MIKVIQGPLATFPLVPAAPALYERIGDFDVRIWDNDQSTLAIFPIGQSANDVPIHAYVYDADSQIEQVRAIIRAMR